DPTAIYPLSLHDALPIYHVALAVRDVQVAVRVQIAHVADAPEPVALDRGARGGGIVVSEVGIGGVARIDGAHLARGQLAAVVVRSEEHTSELQSLRHLVC